LERYCEVVQELGTVQEKDVRGYTIYKKSEHGISVSVIAAVILSSVFQKKPHFRCARHSKQSKEEVSAADHNEHISAF
jgi:heme exporter protein D